MTSKVHIDVTLDLRSDARGGDPDRKSPTLRKYHQLLWSKPLPSGRVFTLRDATPGGYLEHDSELGKFSLSSDTILRTFTNHRRMQPIISAVPLEARESFLTRGYTIGGMIIFPSNRINNQRTINGARGMHPQIEDRIDFTLECIRRHYANEPSPLSGALARYSDFFNLFQDFEGYVRHFLLDDLVSEDFMRVKFFLPFDDFRRTAALPADLEEYEAFRAAMLQFIEGRNQRIDTWQSVSVSH